MTTYHNFLKRKKQKSDCKAIWLDLIFILIYMVSANEYKILEHYIKFLINGIWPLRFWVVSLLNIHSLCYLNFYDKHILLNNWL